MIKVLMVCLGNICRSPMAEFVFVDLLSKANLQNKITVDSAGTSNEEEGNGVHYGTLNKLRTEGIPTYPHFAKQVCKQDGEIFDYIVCMEQRNLRAVKRIIGENSKAKVLCLLDMSKSPRDIADPWYTGNFDITYDDVKEGSEDFFKYIIKEHKLQLD